jgi:hypothetical protein
MRLSCPVPTVSGLTRFARCGAGKITRHFVHTLAARALARKGRTPDGDDPGREDGASGRPLVMVSVRRKHTDHLPFFAARRPLPVAAARVKLEVPIQTSPFKRVGRRFRLYRERSDRHC